MNTQSTTSLLSSAGRRFVGRAVFGFGLIGLSLLVPAHAFAQESGGQDNTSPEHYDPAYPRLGLYAIGYDQTFKPAVWPVFGKFHVVIMGGAWEVWGDSRAYTREDVVSGIKSSSTVGTKVFQYVLYASEYPSGQGFNIGEPAWVDLVDLKNWWLYKNGASGPRVPTSYYNSNFNEVNLTRFAPPDATTGLRPFEMAANFAYNLYYAGTEAHPRNAAPSLDGFYQDNVFWKPRVNGDWNRDGVSDSQNDPTVQFWYRQGEADFPNEMRNLSPDLLVICNNADWPLATNSGNPGDIAPLTSTYNGGILEGLLGASYAIEHSAGFATAMEWYRYTMKTTRPPKLEIINHENLTANGADPYDAAPYHALRYGLCLTLMNDGYYNGDSVHHHSAALADIYWFDEYDGGGIGEGYLGQPVKGSTGAVQTRARWNHGPMGVWAREFDGGIAILNPRGNGAQTISLSDLGGAGKWKHIQGTQDPVTNDGTLVTSDITLADRDGLILLRQ